ncbi:MAG TPA: hypothetical protein VF190_10425, partial [Rhodothermales bacterium]
WGIDGDGQRFLDAAVPAEATEIFMPPLIGYDGTVYLPLREEVLAFGAGGTLAWRTHAGAEIAGAVVTADHQILVTAGPRVLAMDEQGERRLVFQAEGDTLRTAPALVAPNRLYVASAGTLYRLKPMN